MKHYIQIEGGAIHFLDVTQSPVVITYLYVPPHQRNRGIARRLIRAAKADHRHLILSVQPQEKSVNRERLIRFYESEGFELISDKDMEYFRHV